MWFFLLAGMLSGQNLRISFNRQNNFTYSVRSQLRYAYQKNKYRGRAIWDQDLIINTNRKPSSLVLLNVDAEWWQYWKLKKKLELTSFTEVEQFWTTLNQRYSQYVGINIGKEERLIFTPLLGYSWDYRSRRLDQGFSPAAFLRGRYTFEDGTSMATSLWARLKYIEPRHQRNVSLKSNWTKSIENQADLAWGFEIGSNQMDDYRLSSIEQIESDTAAAYFQFRYQLRPGYVWTSDNRMILNRRIFDYEIFETDLPDFNDLRFNQTEILTHQQLDITQEKWKIRGEYQYDYLERYYELENNLNLPLREFDRLVNRERQKDAFRKTNTFNLQAFYQLSPKHSLNIEGNNKYIQYDTPSEENFDDHDELYYGGRLGLVSNWKQDFTLSYNLTAGLRRYAFLFAERSQDNYTQRNLRLDFAYKWVPFNGMRLVGEQRIYVTYNVKDFTDRNLTDRSTRNLESRISADYRLKGKWKSSLQFYRKEIHVSYLNWEEFSETTLDTTITLRIEWKNTYRHRFKRSPYSILSEFGYKHAGRFRQLNTSMTSLENILTPINLHIRTRQTGPSTSVSLLAKQNREMLVLGIWWQWQIQDFVYKEVEEFFSLSANFKEQQLREVDVSFRPFVSFRLNVWLEN
ncbi:MAG: hypothetical protein MRZ79_08155 [Bacteroidia bacterium]|nr:hypothetical protein [Bacteroidia bacterium]